MQKIKSFLESEKGKDVLVVLIVILVGLSSFQMGRLSKSNASTGIKILPAQTGEFPNQNINQEASIILSTANNLNSTGKNFFASNRGSKYYPVGCSAGKDLKPENRVYFETREAAEKAGYELSSSCR